MAQPVNDKLSNWSGVHCWCGVHEWHAGPRQAYRSEKPAGGWQWDNTGTCDECTSEGWAWDLSKTPYRNLRDVPAADWNNSEVRNSNLYQERRPSGNGPGWRSGLRVIMPGGVIGVEFRNCNLDNCNMRPGATILAEDEVDAECRVSTCVRRRVRVMNDRRLWRLNASDEPVLPAKARTSRVEGRNMDPAQIPETLISIAEAEVEEARAKRWRERRREGRRRRAQEGETAKCECIVGADPTSPAHMTTGTANPNCPSCRGRGYRNPLMPEGTPA